MQKKAGAENTFTQRRKGGARNDATIRNGATKYISRKGAKTQRGFLQRRNIRNGATKYISRKGAKTQRGALATTQRFATAQRNTFHAKAQRRKGVFCNDATIRNGAMGYISRKDAKTQRGSLATTQRFATAQRNTFHTKTQRRKGVCNDATIRNGAMGYISRKGKDESTSNFVGLIDLSTYRPID